MSFFYTKRNNNSRIASTFISKAWMAWFCSHNCTERDKKPAIKMMYRYLICLSMIAPLGWKFFAVVYTMDLIKLNMYQRLRDFDVPTVILDEIFADEGNLEILETNWQELEKNGMNGDEIASEVANMIFEQLDITPDQLTDENE